LTTITKLLFFAYLEDRTFELFFILPVIINWFEITPV
jgi:hypothetical protein